MGVIRAAYGRISIPSQLSLIGFDDIHLSSFTTPPLTTIRMSQNLHGSHLMPWSKVWKQNRRTESQGNIG